MRFVLDLSRYFNAYRIPYLNYFYILYFIKLIDQINKRNYHVFIYLLLQVYFNYYLNLNLYPMAKGVEFY